MKKDLEWAMEEIEKERNLLNDRRYEYEISTFSHQSSPLELDDLTTGVLMGMEKALNILNQLEEPEVLSQELPAIPQSVADWIESRDYCNVFKALQDLSASGSPHASKDVRNWIFCNQENVEKFVRAWLDGYTLEEEQKYYALIKGHELLEGKGDWVVPMYWYLDTTNGNMFISDRITVLDNYLIEASKSEWNKLGINNSNADFVKVEELEECEEY